jgi:hypothetical protein
VGALNHGKTALNHGKAALNHGKTALNHGKTAPFIPMIHTYIDRTNERMYESFDVRRRRCRRNATHCIQVPMSDRMTVDGVGSWILPNTC